MKPQIKQLKVKVKSLAEEARIIRLEERKAVARKVPDETLRASLYFHRVWDVRREQRAALLAYAFLRGVEYKRVEPKAAKSVEVVRVVQLVEKFGSPYPGWPKHKDNGEVAKWLAGTLAENPFIKPKKAVAVAG